ncbi:MAG: hypothetical protein KF691_15620 [Phycisphaeraceae bacterium]|nr:hypothetical protein [Phycisphaeraceae bacterium]
MTTLPARLEPLALPAPDAAAHRPGGLLARLSVRWSRLTRREFWPWWVLYVLLLPHFARLVLRHRSLTAFTAANPGIPLGGLVGESKWDILRSLPPEAIVPSAVLEPELSPRYGHRGSTRLRALDDVMSERVWQYPLVLKPDVGERGTGVALVRDREEATAYLASHPGRIVAQTYDRGPFEAGVFYFRHPGKTKGRIFSITDKKFPSVQGDGASTLRTLIWSHPRLRLQARTLLEQLGERADSVPAADEVVPLSIRGNHCRGTMFLDGANLITPELEEAIDSIARRTPGFFFGRFDIRYSCPRAFARGREFRVVELNGVLSESTNIYDPSLSLPQGLRILAEQWTLAFAIGAANTRQGIPPASIRRILRALRDHADRQTS